MLYSMTGFGRAVLHTEQADIQVEIRTLNAKQTDTYLKMPSMFLSKEIELKQLLAQGLQRGKINLLIDYQSKQTEEGIAQLNEPLLRAYYQQLHAFAESLALPTDDLLRHVLTMPDAFTKPDTSKLIEQRYAQLLPVLHEALAQCNAFRRQEGEALEKDLKERITAISELVAQVEACEAARTERRRDRLRNQVAEWENSEAFDRNRFEQELLYYLEKFDIAEEKVRLRTHLAYFSETLAQAEADQAGRKLSFIAQEIGREINTIGSKANDAAMQRVVVNMKEELEKIKEQLFNVL